jgi:hypothetical protein
MVQSALESWKFDEVDFLFFDNVGNLKSGYGRRGQTCQVSGNF